MVKLRDSNSDGGTTESAERLTSLDAVRGVFLLLFISAGLGVQEMLRDDRWNWITSQWSHREWHGCSLWDLLQPALLLLAGIAMPFSFANRQARGQNWFRQFAHAIKRAALLVVLGLYLDSYKEGHLVFDLRGELQQIGLAYLVAFLVLPLGMIVQSVTVGFLLIGQLAAYVIYAIPGGHDFWSRDHNVGLALDRWMHFAPHQEHLVTFNVVPAAAIVLLGVLVGGLVRTGLTPGAKVAVMTLGSLFGIFFGWVLSGGNGWFELSWFAVIPMIRPLMSWTFILASVGWTMLFFTYFYLATDGLLLRAWATPLALVGRNPLILFLLATLARGWALRSALLVLPTTPAAALAWRPLFVSLIVLAIFWSFSFWLYRRRIFFKV
jgi:heparan-alpha-glucosaminide N-acetyltransferase